MAENTDTILCSICLNDFKEPKILDCKHSFCLICLEDYIEKVTTDNHFPCPLCRRDITLPGDGVNEFKTNDHLEKEDIPKCDACKSGISSEFRCEDCHQYLCSTCRKVHDTLTVTNNHVVVEYTKCLEKENRYYTDPENPSGDNPEPTIKDFCSIHHDRIPDYYCKQCMVGVCCRCVVANHNGHSFEDLLDEKIHDETREELNTLKDSVETQLKDLQNYSDSLARIVTDINLSSKVSCRNVDKQVKDLCSLVKKLGEDMKDKIQKSRQDQLKKCTEKLEELKTMIENLKTSVHCFESVLADDSTVEGLKWISQVKKENEDTSLEPFKLPVVTYTWFEEEIIDDRILGEQLGILENLDGPTFRSSFTVGRPKMMDVDIYGDEYYIQGIPCRINVVKEGKSRGLGIHLYVYISQDSNIKSCKFKWSAKLFNQTNK
ncbi:E3 ubiquitin-protein ligase TRIM71 [Patella vulgata]|uniref:E3 ubiquitin-protein ligase TRIM71 n=1 Tax=Patella vulgata TaxID=6465 RepID=UPI002180950C|nr:E3 ubiquitin-protein ligase TRIM71 [Patella vulgata]